MKDVIFPYRTLGTDPEIVVTSPTVDGDPQPILPRDSHIDLFTAPSGWHRARVNVRVIVPTEQLADIGASDPRVVATVHCGPTNLRVAHHLEPSSGGGQWTGEVELVESLLFDRAELYATVAGTVAGQPDRWLGRTRPIQIHLEPPRTPEITTGGQLPVVWRDFSQTEEGQSPIDPALHDEIVFVDLTGVRGPTIYLNDRVTGLRRLLDDRTGRSAIERAARELTFDMIAQSALVSMFNAALSAAVEIAEEDVPQLPSAEWQRGVLEALLPLMYPDRDTVASLSDAAEAVLAGDDAQDMQTRLLAAAGRHVRNRAHVTQTMTAIENLDEER